MNKGIIDLVPAAVEAIKQKTMKKMEFFDSVGKERQNGLVSEEEIIKRVLEEVRKVIGN